VEIYVNSMQGGGKRKREETEGEKGEEKKRGGAIRSASALQSYASGRHSQLEIQRKAQFIALVCFAHFLMFTSKAHAESALEKKGCDRQKGDETTGIRRKTAEKRKQGRRGRKKEQ